MEIAKRETGGLPDRKKDPRQCAHLWKKLWITSANPTQKTQFFSLVNRYSILIYDTTPYLSTEICRAPRVAGGITCEQSHAPIW
jgi:hypothetical protein